MKVSLAYKDGAVLKVVRDKPVPPFRKFFRRLVKRMIKDLTRLSFKPCRLEVYLGDARRMDFLEDEMFDAIITSPPYLNKIEYTKVYRIEYELFFGDVKIDPVRVLPRAEPEEYRGSVSRAESARGCEGIFP
ncbi:MAG: hypothetical protein L2C94_002725 [Aigarchaeota archaeon]|nr:hypothetical protein [Candidatus Wolframiiraptor gerlachensis]